MAGMSQFHSSITNQPNARAKTAAPITPATTIPTMRSPRGGGQPQRILSSM